MKGGNKMKILPIKNYEPTFGRPSANPRIVSPVAPPGIMFPVSTKVLMLVAMIRAEIQIVRIRANSFFSESFILLSSICF